MEKEVPEEVLVKNFFIIIISNSKVFLNTFQHLMTPHTLYRLFHVRETSSINSHI